MKQKKKGKKRKEQAAVILFFAGICLLQLESNAVMKPAENKDWLKWEAETDAQAERETEKAEINEAARKTNNGGKQSAYAATPSQMQTGIFLADANQNQNNQTGETGEETGIAPYYANFINQTLSASVVEGNTLRISMDVDVWDDSYGDSGRCLYQLAPELKINTYSGALQTPWVEMQKTYRASRGQLTAESFRSTSSSMGDGARRLQFQGYWDLRGEDLKLFAEQVQGDTLYWAAGLKEEASYSLSHGSVRCDNLANAIRTANCAHASERFEAMEGDKTQHKRYCADCGAFLGQEAHNFINGLCEKCGYTAYVTGNFVYELNGRTETESYAASPGSRHIPKAFRGYQTPASKEIPEEGGEIRFVYTPIQYQIDTGDAEPMTLRYDDSIRLPVQEKKGHTQVFYFVK